MTRISVISGFLGAGKTTFANLLLDYYIRMGEKTVYVVNEFGQTGMDSALLGAKGFQTVDIFGGCVCCTLRGKITEALREVIAEYNPARIVFEPSGVFVFDKFLEVLEDEFLKDRCRVENVITIVDSHHLTKGMLVPGNFFANQVAHADTMIFSKLESFGGDVAEIVAQLGGLNERAALLSKPWHTLTDEDFAALDREASDGIHADGDAAGGHAHMDTLHVAAKALDEAELAALFQQVKDGVFGEIYRIKGGITYCGAAGLLQAAFDSYRVEENPPAGTGGLTFIGRHLDEDKIRALWA